MLGANPSFPPIETWQKMSESEQDALIQIIEVNSPTPLAVCHHACLRQPLHSHPTDRLLCAPDRQVT